MKGSPEYHRGDVLLVRLDPVEGSEQGGTRPVVVISNDILNETLPVLTVAAMTTRKTERVFPTEVLITPPDGGLSKPGKVLLYQIRTIAKPRVARKLGAVSTETLASIEEALRLAFDLN